MSTTTSTIEVKAALPADFSGETEDAILWINAMEAYFQVNLSIYTTDDAKSVTMLNKMSQGWGCYFADTWLYILADSNVKAADKDFDHVKQAFADMFYPYHWVETARDELNNLKQVATWKDNGFQTYLSKFQNLVAQSQAGDTPEVQSLFAEGLDIQITTMIYSMEKVPDTLKAWMNKAIDFHKQKACIMALKKGHSLPLSSFFFDSHSTRDPNAMDVDTICLRKLSPADCACCMREGLCFKCRKKGHSTNECQSSQTQGKPKGNNHPQQGRNIKTSSFPTPTTATITPITSIDAYIQNLTTKGRTTEDILQTLKICYEDDGEDVAAATTFSDNEGFWFGKLLQCLLPILCPMY